MILFTVVLSSEEEEEGDGDGDRAKMTSHSCSSRVDSPRPGGSERLQVGDSPGPHLRGLTNESRFRKENKYKNVSV